MARLLVVCLLLTAPPVLAQGEPSPIDPRWWAHVQRSLAEEQLDLWTRPDMTSRAASVDVDFQTIFDPKGIEVAPRRDAAWSVRYEFVGARVGDRRLTWQADVPPAVSGKTARFPRGEIVEMYENTPVGVEQKFVLPSFPVGWAGRATTGETDLVIDGVFRTSLAARRVAGSGILFSEGGTDHMRYTEPVVFDASGRHAPAELRLAEAPGDRWHTSIHVPGSWLQEAVYPVTIDPLSTSPDWSRFGNPGDQFGLSVSTAGDVNGDGYGDVIVGAPYYDNGHTNEGAARIYHGSAGGLPMDASTTIEGNLTNMALGLVVASAGNVNCDAYSDVAISALYNLDGTGGRTLFVHHGSPTGVSATPNWAAHRTAAGADEFGVAVSHGRFNDDLCSDLAVGASALYLSPPGATGFVFVWHGSSSGLGPLPWPALNPVESANWTGWVVPPATRYGTSVGGGDFNGDGWDDLAVGAPHWSNTMPPTSIGGRILVYNGSASGLPVAPPGPPPHSWDAISDRSNGMFGASLGNAGDVNGDGYADLIVGEPGRESGPSGRVTVLYGNNARPRFPIDTPFFTLFGFSVSTAGDVNGDGFADFIVGEPSYDLPITDVGSVRLFEGGPGDPTAVESKVGAQQSDEFGWAVSFAGDVNGDGYSDIVAGARAIGAPGAAGYARVYHGHPRGLSPSPMPWSPNPPPSLYGNSASSAGDVNGDGYADIAIGAPGYDGGQVDEGRVFVYHGSPTGPSSVADWTAESNQTGAWFGVSVASAGDVNADGFSDLIVGAHNYDNVTSNSGRAFVFHSRGTAGLNTQCNNGASAAIDCADWSIGADGSCDHLGFSVAGAGDVNGNGATEVIIGAVGEGTLNQGRAVVFCGTPGSGLTCSSSLAPPCSCFDRFGPGPTSQFGWSVASAGDVNADSYSDIIIGAPGCGMGTTGRAYVYYGADVVGLPAGDILGNPWIAEGDQASEWFGGSVAGGDFNGDGVSDVLIGAPDHDGAATDTGRVFAWHGSPAPIGLGTVTGTPSNADWTYQGTSATAKVGYRVASAGDVDGDADTEVIVSAPRFDSTTDGNEGRVYVFYGSDLGPAMTPSIWYTGSTTDSLLGFGIATAGDVSGDGFDDVIITAHWISSAWVYAGNTTQGLSVLPHQRQPTSSAPIQLLGESTSTSVGLGLLQARNWMGASRIKLDFEVAPLGTDFDGTPDFATGWLTLGTLPSSLTAAVGGLAADKAYHWRVRVRSFPHWAGPWYSKGPNGDGETDFRTP